MMKTTLAVLAGGVLLAAVYSHFIADRERAQQSEAEEETSRGVTESELETYIAVYKAMQADHGLTIERALEPYGLSLKEFRDTERRIQKEQRYVDRVREALLEYARSRAAQPPAKPGDESPGPSGE